MIGTSNRGHNNARVYTTQPPPRIAPVNSGIARPAWSVMIPSYNCAQYLRQTLESVLVQAPAAEQMQIEVVDDCSTKDDPEEVVREIGQGRVLFYRKERNEGAVPNFNTCIQRSCGHLVHILHGDDCVGPDFYVQFGSAFENSRQCAGIFSRALVIDQEGDLIGVSPHVRSLKTESRNPGEMLLMNCVQTPAVVIRRSFYEENGGFCPALVHAADWEMWVRVIVRGGGRMLNRALASYRSHAANDTSRLHQSAENLHDLVRLAAKWEAEKLPAFNRDTFDRAVMRLAFQQWHTFRSLGNEEGARATYSFMRQNLSMTQCFLLNLRSHLRSAKRYMRARD
jgi:GT2 family glycosyltransferase